MDYVFRWSFSLVIPIRFRARLRLMVSFSVLLVVMFVSYRRIYRRVNMGSTMTLSLLVRLSVFCSFRLLFAVILVTWLGLFDTNPDSNATMIMGDIDILQVWFPCIHFGAKHTRSTPSQAESNWALDTEVLAIH
ncbi:hypothetical protein JB92DRAFT_3023492 [Gautieria morchelliformis]|nr:hypothetical protein JB92DRAFT_3023492 [Gautieria morchelliformis]